MNVNRVTAMVLVQDMDRAIRFYRDILGFQVMFEEEDWAVFDRIHARNRDKDPEEVERDVAEAISEVREQARREASRAKR